MDFKKEDKWIRQALSKISKEDIIEFIKSREEEGIPISVFNTGLAPLEAATRYLKDKLNKRVNEIARILNKNPSSISNAYKNSKNKKFSPKKAELAIPLLEFKKNPNLSILEVIVRYLRSRGMRFTEIAKLLGRNPKTVWTAYDRGVKKKG